MTAETLPRDERLLRTDWLRRTLRRPEVGAVAGFIFILIFFALAAGGSGLFSAKGVVNFLEVSAQLGILAVAVALLMIAGEFDLSIGSMIGLAGVVIAIPSTVLGWPVWACVLLAFAVAALVGWLNGVVVVRTGLPSFIVTLASLFILRGVTLGLTRLITGRTQIPGMKELAEKDFLAPLFNGQVLGGFCTWLAEAGIIGRRPDGVAEITGLPISILWWIALCALGTWVLMRTRFGNWTFAAGGDANAARNVGVPVARVKIWLFIASAMAAALFAAIQVLAVGSADTARGLQKEFEAIIAVVIGGTLLTGGYGSVIGPMFGALIFGTVQMGIFYTGIDTDWFKAFMGAMLLVAVLFNSYVRKKAMATR